MNSPRSTRTSENEREFVSSSRLPPDFVLPSSSTSDHMASTYLPPPPPPRKRVLTTSPHPTASKAKRAIFAIDTQASGEENLDRDRQDGQSRQYYARSAKIIATESLAKLQKPPKKQ